MKDKKTLITIIVLLCIFIPLSFVGTYNKFTSNNKTVEDENTNKEIFYNDKVYFYQDGNLLASVNCSNCSVVSISDDSEDYHTNSYKSNNKELNVTINSNIGIYKENDDIKVYNLSFKGLVGNYTQVKTYGVEHTNPMLILENSNSWGVIFTDLSQGISFEYDYISVPAHLTNNILDTSKYIVYKDSNWSIINKNREVIVDNVYSEIVDFNDNYYITYDGSYHVYDFEKNEYLSSLPKDNVYGVGKYIFVVTSNNLLIYENLNETFVSRVELPNYNTIYFNQTDESIDIIIDNEVYQSVTLNS